MQQSHTLSSRYDADHIEKNIYQFWESQDFFDSQDTSSQPAYCIMLPPPNVTGSLHLGHALDHTIQDVLIRWKRMSGFNTLWQPGLDHAGIATQSVVEKHLHQQGIDPKQIGRDTFLEHAWSWKHTYSDRIIKQMKRLGDSCDWKKTRFTLDKNLSRAVKKVFVTLYREGLIYRGERLVNWDVKLGSAVSDLEVEHVESDGFLWHIKYPLSNSSDHLIVATTRPETLLGDTALFVHPEDQRYQKHIGQKAILPLLNKQIPIIADTFVDQNFGSGVVKVTPAHDFTDYDIGKKYNLPFVNILNVDGTLNDNAGPYKGLNVTEARQHVLEDLKQQGLFVQQEPYKLTVPVSQRSAEVIEPFLSKQWFVKSSLIAEPAKKVFETKTITFEPELWINTYLHWMNNIQDWCISRQLWWGHRIPAWFCKDCDQISVAEEDLQTCQHCQSSHITQEEDVLDTWFSSALWPFTTLGWPDQTPALKTFYPTDVLVTGHDIIFFWVSRMVMSGLHHIKDIPFKKVYIHGIVRDEKGKKMSKSLGNTLDPIQLIDEYGADALRFALISQVSNSRDLKFSKKQIETSRNFLNKIWNATRFALSCVEKTPLTPNMSDFKNLNPADQWIIYKLGELEKLADQKLEDFRFSDLATLLYAFVWHDFCDWYLEFIKPIVYDKDEQKKQTTLTVLFMVLNRICRLLHPLIPFVTEEIYQKLPIKNQACIIDSFPRFDTDQDFLQWGSKKVAFEVDLMKEIITAIRNIRGENHIKPGQPIPVKIILENNKYQHRLEANKSFMMRLAKLKSLEVLLTDPQLSKTAVSYVHTDQEKCKVVVPIEGLVNFNEEIKRLEKNLRNVSSEMQAIQARLNNPDFIKNAPAQVVEQHKQKWNHLQIQHKNLEDSLSRFQ